MSGILFLSSGLVGVASQIDTSKEKTKKNNYMVLGLSLLLFGLGLCQIKHGWYLF